MITIHSTLGQSGPPGQREIWDTWDSWDTFQTAQALSQPKTTLFAVMERFNLSICTNYAICLTLSYFFSKIVGQRLKTAITPIKTVSCVSQTDLGHAWDKKLWDTRDTWDSRTRGTPGTVGTAVQAALMNLATKSASLSQLSVKL